LARHVRDRARVAEIGVWHGVTTKRLRAAMAAHGVLWAVDPFPRGRLGVSFGQRIAHVEVETVENAKVRWVRMTGVEAGRLWSTESDEPIEFVFIDAEHSWDGISGDWSAWSHLVGAGGIVALHDSRVNPGGVTNEDTGSVQFTRAVILKDERYRLIEEVDSLTVVERVR
jgi:predicted O-methyltransferase YrrM